MFRMDNLIRIYDNVLSAEKCSYFVNKFEEHSNMHETQLTGTISASKYPAKTLTRLNLMKSKDTPFREDLDFLANVFMENVERYKKSCNLKSFQFPKEFGLEPFAMKRYLPNSYEEFPQHIDVSGIPYSKRFLAMFIYLVNNDSGQTEINCMNTTISSPCKQGSIILFPPYWPWVHAGVAPAKTAKYILGTYCNYVPDKISRVPLQRVITDFESLQYD